MSSQVDLSVVVPVLNEEQSVKELYETLKETLDSLGVPYEIVFVDDGSIDGTYNALETIHRSDPTIKVIQFRRNLGKSMALEAGFRHSRGKTIITMDGDLQDDPAEIPKFLEKIEEGYDLVVGWRFKRKDSWIKRSQSRIFNVLTSDLVGPNLHDHNCGFKAMKREVADVLSLSGEMYRFIPTLANQYGFRVGEIKVRHSKRRYGKSKYRFTRLIKGSMDLITLKFLTDYSTSPLYVFGLLGIGFLSIGFAIGLYILYIKLLLREPFGAGRPIVTLSSLFIIVGIVMISIGLVAEMIVKREVERNKERLIEGYIKTQLGATEE
jgi:glycosyltransferase involved in cell wall biosynthesis